MKRFFKIIGIACLGLIGFFIILSILIGVFSSNTDKKETKKTTIDSVKSKIEKKKEEPNLIALKEIKQEAKIKEALITDSNVLYVTVDDDGTSRNGYAEYLCQLLKEYKATANWVKVIKVNSTKDPNKDNIYGVLLGESHCN